MSNICSDILLITNYCTAWPRYLVVARHTLPISQRAARPGRVVGGRCTVGRRGGGGGAACACVRRRYVAVWSHGVSHGTDALKRRLRAPAHAHHCLPMRCAYRSLQYALCRAMHVNCIASIIRSYISPVHEFICKSPLTQVLRLVSHRKVPCAVL